MLLATRTILLPFVLALVIAYVLTPAVSQVERTRVPRWVAVLIVYTVTLGATYGFFSLVTPRLVRETVGLHKELPGLSVKLRDQWVPALYGRLQSVGLLRAEPDTPHESKDMQAVPSAPSSSLRVQRNPDGSYDVHLSGEVEVRSAGQSAWRISHVGQVDARQPSVDLAKMLEQSVDKAVAWGQRNIVEVLRFGSSIVATISRGIFLFFLTLMLAAYIMISREQIIDCFRALAQTQSRPSFNLWLRRIDRGLAGVVRGQLLICLVNGILTAIGFSLLGVKYWPILSIVAGVMSIIPIFGSILSSIPAVAIGLTQGFGTAIAALAWIVGIHQVEANVLNPKIYGIAAKIHPVLVIFALLVGEHFFGLVGALLAVPCMSIVQNTFIHFRTASLGPDAPTDSFAGWLLPGDAGAETHTAKPAPARAEPPPPSAPGGAAKPAEPNQIPERPVVSKPPAPDQQREKPEPDR
ncbi:MAG: AI-2E family transporter [Polyangiaceae bacterium]|nr:AI-2E family transporter [Polyangiaceae bacterium]